MVAQLDYRASFDVNGVEYYGNLSFIKRVSSTPTTSPRSAKLCQRNQQALLDQFAGTAGYVVKISVVLSTASTWWNGILPLILSEKIITQNLSAKISNKHLAKNGAHER